MVLSCEDSTATCDFVIELPNFRIEILSEVQKQEHVRRFVQVSDGNQLDNATPGWLSDRFNIYLGC